MRKLITLGIALALTACAAPKPAAPAGEDVFYGTLEPFASEAIYFVVTDRFVDGDKSNDYRGQGGAHRTFDVPIAGPIGETANIGYLGGDFKGVLDNADYIRGMGFGAVWITPITDNPDEAFTGGDPVTWGSGLTDRGKTGYHGYWSDNFFKLDEHLPSAGLDFAAFTHKMRDKGLQTVLDIVANHGSPAWTMPVMQPQFGKIYDGAGKLVADQQNLPPEKLDPAHNPLHAFYKTKPILAQLSNIDENNPAALDYFVAAYEQWIDQGAAAFRIDAIGLTPVSYWKKFSARIREKHPGFFMFGENFDYDANKIAPYTRAEGGAITVLDFPLKQKIAEVFEHPHSDYAQIAPRLFLENGPYRNPYELITFYDNHDMARLNATDQGFIDAHNFLFTARGIPVIYYGSETGFMRGRPEHAGNRNYYGQRRVDAASRSPIYAQLKRIANLRKGSIALQRGLQLDVSLQGDSAVFYRVYENAGTAQTALVLLNKGDGEQTFDVRDYLQSGRWRDSFSGQTIAVADHLSAKVPAHGVQVYFYDQPLTRADMRARLAQLMANKGR
ncbi:MAG TPA: alpha-amylase family glycosyl hydrolase [Rudaea sp.]|jgi:cyclomaltodextrin glucanotransferase|uniref:alpha-amylase family glycosyl hydrolase n=1 Tax=Rudaea sp. TaxID=2136325 RepID=UPI002F9276F6